MKKPVFLVFVIGIILFSFGGILFYQKYFATSVETHSQQQLSYLQLQTDIALQQLETLDPTEPDYLIGRSVLVDTLVHTASEAGELDLPAEKHSDVQQLASISEKTQQFFQQQQEIDRIFDYWPERGIGSFDPAGQKKEFAQRTADIIGGLEEWSEKFPHLREPLQETLTEVETLRQTVEQENEAAIKTQAEQTVEQFRELKRSIHRYEVATLKAELAKN